jgi:hypothetical protein
VALVFAAFFAVVPSHEQLGEVVPSLQLRKFVAELQPKTPPWLEQQPALAYAPVNGRKSKKIAVITADKIVERFMRKTPIPLDDVFNITSF